MTARDDLGALASGAVSNLFGLADGTLRTPERAVRHGVTREVVLSVAEQMGVGTRRGPVSDIETVEAAALTNSTWGVRPIERVDDTRLPTDDPRLDDIARAYYRRAPP